MYHDVRRLSGDGVDSDNGIKSFDDIAAAILPVNLHVLSNR